MDCNTISLLEDDNITALLPNGGRGYGWFTSEGGSFTNYSIILLKVDNITLYTECNTGGNISVPIIESTFGNDYIHTLNYMSKQYIQGYLVSKSIGSEATIRNII